ncbi:glycosyltransferase [Geodermatophilus sp. SYSU D00697]
MSSRPQPLVSVVIPCHNGGRYLGEAIESVLTQTYEPVELIVVDDGSTDESAVIAGRYGQVRYVGQANSGPAAARNTGLDASIGTFCLFLDADDRLEPGALGTSVALLGAHPDSAFVSGHCTLIAPDGSPLFTPYQLLIERDHRLELLRSNYIWALDSVLHRREALDQVDGFDVTAAVGGAEDYDLYLRLAARFPVTAHGEVVVEYRQHAASRSIDAAVVLASVRQALENQRRHATDPQHAAALAAGLQWYQDFYDDPLLRTIRAEWSDRLIEIEPLLCSLTRPEDKEPLLDELRRLYQRMLTAFGLIRTIRDVEGRRPPNSEPSAELRAVTDQLDRLLQDTPGTAGRVT